MNPYIKSGVENPLRFLCYFGQPDLFVVKEIFENQQVVAVALGQVAIHRNLLARANIREQACSVNRTLEILRVAYTIIAANLVSADNFRNGRGFSLSILCGT